MWLGHTFLSSVYTTFNFTNTPAQIGFVPLNDARLNVTAERVSGDAGSKPTGTIPGLQIHSSAPVGSSTSTSGADGLAASGLFTIVAALVALF